MGVKRKSINNSGISKKLRKIDGAVNQKTPNKSPNTSAKKRQRPKKINANKSPKKNKKIPENTYEGKWKVDVNINEESFSGEENDFEDSEDSAGAVNQKTPNKSPKTPAKIPISKKIKKSAKKTQKNIKNIPEDEQMEVNLNEDSDEENLEDSKIASIDEQESDSDEDENKNEDEQNDSDEVIKQPSPKKQMHLDRNKFTAYVSGLRGTDFQIPDIFKDCNYTYYTMLKKLGKLTGYAFVNFDVEENYKKALEKNGTVIKGVTINVVPKRNKQETYNIFVGNLNRISKIERIFSNCKIVARKILPRTKSALLYLEDEDSIQKALEKNQTEHDGCTIIVQRKDCNGFVKEKEEPSPKKQIHSNKNKFTVYVDGFPWSNFRIQDVFKDCNYTWYKLFKNEFNGEIIGSAFFDFDNEENYKKALAKNETEINGVTITVEPKRSKDDDFHIYNIHVRNLKRPSKIKNIFSDCKILRSKIFYQRNIAFLDIEDEDSIQKALEKDQTEHDGSKITVQRTDCTVFVKGLTNSFKPDEFFSNCKIYSYKLHVDKNTGETYSGVVHLSDIASYKNALAKSGTNLEDKIIYVQPFVTSAENYKKKALMRNKQFLNKNAYKPFNKFTDRPFKKNTNTPFKKNTKTFVTKNTNNTIAKNNE